MDKTSICVESYARLKNLKMVENETGIKWQTVYYHLKKSGVEVVGDKKKYGSETDKFAARAESAFLELVPDAVDMNRKKFQSKYDFDVFGLKVDVKASQLRKGDKEGKYKRWAFSIKKQRLFADFMVCFCFSGEDIVKTIFIPCDICRNHGTISIGERGGKWDAFCIDKNDISNSLKLLSEVM